MTNIDKVIYARRPPIEYNPIYDVDSYKCSHFYSDSTAMYASLEARGGAFDEATLFGLQYTIHAYLTEPVRIGHVTEMQVDMALHGVSFDAAMWQHIVDKYDGKLPLMVRAIPEGTVVPVGVPVLTVKCTDPVCFPIVGWLEDVFERVWYASTIAIQSRQFGKAMWKYLSMSSDNPELEFPFKVHDFGARGCATYEQAMLGGGAHLLSFMGTDTLVGARMLKHMYDAGEVGFAGYSIHATEHSMMTSRGREGELDVAEEFIIKYLVNRQVPQGAPKLAACVIDSYDYRNFVRAMCSERFQSLILKSGGTLVLRPDSGKPLEVLPEILNMLEELLPKGSVTVNTKGFKVLPPHMRLIQGDGIDLHSMTAILECLTNLGWSISNLAFGSGGGLLQKVNRDTQKWAYKTNALMKDGTWVGISKDPIGDPGKRSKAGLVDTIRKPNGEISWALVPDGLDFHPDSIMNTVLDHGNILFHNTLAECRQRIAIARS